MRHIIIAGSRDFFDYTLFCSIVTPYLQKITKQEPITLLSGHCSGTDHMTERYAHEHHLPLKIFPADWKRYGRGAGPKRNQQMVEIADFALCFSSGGKGTRSLISFAEQKGIPVEVHCLSVKNEENR